ncbi:MAG: aminotransferase class I/II-fold pyridoxal phosphate-dependent enzyme [Robiginitomaculum sp.]|nr:aminotransferase class I/II-fold pyridoxal phosphate-dependent enzyme [Robiginitomaculum sp.]MDQ7077449.1 aminotransferase class I/II-fold pyridoxal phosphate-dependent enzyme [Robiginitomaculum sp.]
MSSIFDKFAPLQEQHASLTALGRSPADIEFQEIISPTEATLNGKRTILMGTNNYLGLTFDDEAVEAAIESLRTEGTGTTGSRIANGSYDGHKELEKELAEFYGMRSAILFSTGYQANLGAIAALAGRDDYLLIDADSHASIYDACRLSDAQVIRFRHNDPQNLARKLERLEGTSGSKLIVVESIYSMLGDMAPLKEFIEIKKKYGAYLLIDEAHSLGVMGEKGRGLCEQTGLEDDVDFITGTFSKSIGTVGGFLVSNLPGLDIVRFVSRPYMFTASPPPSVVASARKTLSKIAGATDLRKKLWDNAGQLYNGLKAAGFELGPTLSPIVAIRLSDSEKAIALWNGLLDAGIYTNLALPPATPFGWYLLRSSISAAHTPEQIALAVDVCSTIGRELGLIAVSNRKNAEEMQVNGAKTLNGASEKRPFSTSEPESAVPTRAGAPVARA